MTPTQHKTSSFRGGSGPRELCGRPILVLFGMLTALAHPATTQAQTPEDCAPIVLPPEFERSGSQSQRTAAAECNRGAAFSCISWAMLTAPLPSDESTADAACAILSRDCELESSAMACATRDSTCAAHWQTPTAWARQFPCSGAPIPEPENSVSLPESTLNRPEFVALLYVNNQRVSENDPTFDAFATTTELLVDITSPNDSLLGSLRFLAPSGMPPSETNLAEIARANPDTPILAVLVLEDNDGTASVQMIRADANETQAAYGFAADGEWLTEVLSVFSQSGWLVFASADGSESAQTGSTSVGAAANLSSTNTSRATPPAPNRSVSTSRPVPPEPEQAPHHLNSPVGLHVRAGVGLYYANAVFDEETNNPDFEQSEPTNYAFGAAVLLRLGNVVRLGYAGGTRLKRGVLELDVPIKDTPNLLPYAGLSAGTNQEQVIVGAQVGVSFRLFEVAYAFGSIEPIYNVDFGQAQLLTLFGLELRL